MRTLIQQFFQIIVRVNFFHSLAELFDLLVDLLELQCVLTAVLIHQFLIILLDHLVMEVVVLDLPQKFLKLAVLRLDLLGGEGILVLFWFQVALPVELILRMEDLPF